MDLEKRYRIIGLAERILVSIASDPNVDWVDIDFCFATALEFEKKAEKFLDNQAKLDASKEKLK